MEEDTPGISSPLVETSEAENIELAIIMIDALQARLRDIVQLHPALLQIRDFEMRLLDLELEKKEPSAGSLQSLRDNDFPAIITILKAYDHDHSGIPAIGGAKASCKGNIFPQLRRSA